MLFVFITKLISCSCLLFFVWIGKFHSVPNRISSPFQFFLLYIDFWHDHNSWSFIFFCLTSFIITIDICFEMKRKQSLQSSINSVMTSPISSINSSFLNHFQNSKINDRNEKKRIPYKNYFYFCSNIWIWILLCLSWL